MLLLNQIHEIYIKLLLVYLYVFVVDSTLGVILFHCPWLLQAGQKHEVPELVQGSKINLAMKRKSRPQKIEINVLQLFF